MFLMIYCFHFVSSFYVCICFVTLNMGLDCCTQKHRKRKRDQPIGQSLICFLSISFQNGMFSLCLHSFFCKQDIFLRVDSYEHSYNTCRHFFFFVQTWNQVYLFHRSIIRFVFNGLRLELTNMMIMLECQTCINCIIPYFVCLFVRSPGIQTTCIYTSLS